MGECLGVGLVFITVGFAGLWLRLTKKGRDLWRGYNRLPLPKRIRQGPVGDRIANFMVASAGVLLSIVGIVGLVKAVYSWASGTACR